MSRWDHILDRKPQEIRDYVLDKVADELVDDLRRFPPRIEEWLDAALEARYANVLSRLGRPELDTYRVACELAREEMLREYELIDRFCRSDEYRRLLPNELEQQTAHFITRYLVDFRAGIPGACAGKVPPARPGHADGEGRTPAPARLPLAALIVLAPALGRTVVAVFAAGELLCA